MPDSTPALPDTDPPDLPPAGSAPAELLSTSAPRLQLPPPQQFPVVSSADGRVVLTNDKLEIKGQAFGWWELEGVDVVRVCWLLWLLLGGFTLAGFLLGFLQNWLRAMPAALGMMAGSLLLALGQRGTNRLRLHRLGREAAHFALPGELQAWQKLVTEINRRIRQRHHEAAEAATAALLAATATSPDAPTAPATGE